MESARLPRELTCSKSLVLFEGNLDRWGRARAWKSVANTHLQIDSARDFMSLFCKWFIQITRMTQRNERYGASLPCWSRPAVLSLPHRTGRRALCYLWIKIRLLAVQSLVYVIFAMELRRMQWEWHSLLHIKYGCGKSRVKEDINCWSLTMYITWNQNQIWLCWNLKWIDVI